MNEQTEDARIERMLNQGKLTAEEAQRLRRSLDDARQHEKTFERAVRSTRNRRPIMLLLALLVLFFVLGIGTYWLLSEGIGAGAQVVTSELPAPSRPEGRLIDLSELSGERSTTMNRSVPLSIGIITICLIALLAGLIAFFYNGLVTTREQVNAGWAQVENVYQRRLDLVPLLVDAVQTYTDHERETLTELTAARVQAIESNSAIGSEAPQTVEQIKAIEASQGRVESGLARLFAVVENYPDLKASRNFLTLQDQIEGTENRVAIERRNYNEFSRRYNTRLQVFPSNIVGQMMGFDSKPYFEAEDKALKGLGDVFGRDER
ncbi:MAG: LemA family protein [Gammaproteobacteria bacterium]|nr:LemA family protein [Gammaproteobacteria bacterium]